MKVRLIGTVKVLSGLAALLGGFVLLYPLLQENSGNVRLLTGNLIGFALLEAYASYIVYSGWSEFGPERRLRRGILWSGVGGSLVFFLVMLWVTISEASEEMVIGGAVTLGLILFVGIRDGVRLKEAALRQGKKQLQAAEPGASLE